MTEENQKRRAYLAEIETIIHETLASQSDDCVRCGTVLDRGVNRIADIVVEYQREWPWAVPS